MHAARRRGDVSADGVVADRAARLMMRGLYPRRSRGYLGGGDFSFAVGVIVQGKLSAARYDVALRGRQDFTRAAIICVAASLRIGQGGEPDDWFRPGRVASSGTRRFRRRERHAFGDLRAGPVVPVEG
jgi:hypothetical protein